MYNYMHAKMQPHIFSGIVTGKAVVNLFQPFPVRRRSQDELEESRGPAIFSLCHSLCVMHHTLMPPNII